MKRILFIIVFVIGIFAVLCMYINLADTKELQRDTYVSLASQEILDGWSCTKKIDRENFIFALMERLTPDDRTTLEAGRRHKKELENKEAAGILTVKERESLYSGNYNDDEFLQLNENFQSPRCEKDLRSGILFQPTDEAVQKSCALPYMSVSRQEGKKWVQVIYEDRYSRWTLPAFALPNEYDRMSVFNTMHRMARLQQQAEHRTALRQKAESIVSGMKASQITAGSEEKQVDQLYSELLCTEE